MNKLSKELKPLGVPVLLSVQIDSVGVKDAEVLTGPAVVGLIFLCN